MVGPDTERSGFSEFDGKGNGGILNAIKAANIDDVKDIDDQ